MRARQDIATGRSSHDEMMPWLSEIWAFRMTSFLYKFDKHTGSMNLADLVTDGVDQIQQQFDPLRKQVDRWQYTPLSDNDARLAIYWAFMGGEIKTTMEL
jgi:hypothetical protein